MQAVMMTQHQQTMSSREIADLTGKQHGHVMRDIELMLADLGEGVEGYLHFWTHPQNGQRYRKFMLDRDHVDCLLTGYSAMARMRVIKRWKELEHGQPALPNFSNPVEAARAWADEVENKLRAEAALENARPAMQFVERYVDTRATKSLREVAKVLGLPERVFIMDLVNDGVLYRQSGNLLPRQRHHHAKRFEVKTGERNGHAYIQTRVTAAGIEWLAKQYSHAIGDGDAAQHGDLL